MGRYIMPEVNFTEDQIEDIKDGFELYDRTGEGKLFFNQVGDLVRGLGFKPTNKDIAEILGNPKKEEMATSTCNFDTFLGYVKKATEPSWAPKSATFWRRLARSSPSRRSRSSLRVPKTPTARSTTKASSRS